MIQIEANNPDYQKGFNEGYTIAAHMPELSERLVHFVGDSYRSQGFRDGTEELLTEKIQERYPAWLKQDWSKGLDADREDPTPDKEMDEYEPD